jgi:hypothetical protein
MFAKRTLYSDAPHVPKKQLYREEDLGALARRFREAAGRTKAEAAKDLNVGRPSVQHAEESPGQSLFRLRKRIIEQYSSYKVSGPFYVLEGK